MARKISDALPEPSELALKRLAEAQQSVQWSLSTSPDSLWIINRNGRLDESAIKLIDSIREPDLHKESAPDEARELVDLTAESKRIW